MHNIALHACDFLPLNDGNHRSVTLRNLAGVGVMAWAGALRPGAIMKCADQIEADDYAYVESVTFRALPEVWKYFAQREFSVLIEDLRHQAAAAGFAAHAAPDAQLSFPVPVRRSTAWVRLLALRTRAVEHATRRILRTA